MTDEAKLEAMAQRLGARAAERVNVERTAALVLERLRAEPTQSHWLRIAAALVVLVGAGVLGRQLLVAPDTGDHTVAHFVRDDLTELSTDELQQVLSTLDETLDSGGATLPDADLEDLDAQQLRAVLRTLEG